MVKQVLVFRYGFHRSSVSIVNAKQFLNQRRSCNLADVKAALPPCHCRDGKRIEAEGLPSEAAHENEGYTNPGQGHGKR